MRNEISWSWELVEFALVAIGLSVVLLVGVGVISFAVYTWVGGVDNHISTLPLWYQIVNVVVLLWVMGMVIRDLLTLPERIFGSKEDQINSEKPPT
ncbi:MAG: hypothetical protein A2Z42_02170 [Candidatus Woykebacteria bacterium RBG_19FT_COMBO_43_10]|uniref:Uncharacterized protein n=1 Tax=Candidatus Woykebacteria bacterium RBG_19FT_COMBO_43_10 TaxID=1802598 RepID=A0A1G1WJI0_9BACT|nr:MAG: hypothetical protein A2Z42_02170 [Candidatus Woykebacteria bacterium RBG_19FT_COMBO_43_10]